MFKESVNSMFTIYYISINLSASINCCFFPGIMHLSFGISIDFSSSSISFGISTSDFGLFEELCDAAPVISSSNLFPIKSSMVSAVFRIAFFETVLRASVVDFLA